MDRPRDSQRSTQRAKDRPKAATDDPKTAYLILYNFFSATLWFSILLLTVTTTTSLGPQYLYPYLGDLVKWTQTLAALEIAHSLSGLVRSPVLTTVMQVASRFLLVWGVVDRFPQVAQDERFGGCYAYAGMLAAWSVTEVVRYGYFAMALGWGVEKVPGVVKWARYNGFWVLYPLGIGSECFLIYLAATGPARFINIGGVRVSWGLWVVLGVYVPGKLGRRCGLQGKFC